MKHPAQIEHDVTGLLQVMNGGDQEAFGRLMPRVYDHLQRLARQCLARERAGHTLDAAELVHETYLKLAGAGRAGRVAWKDRSHFFAVSSRIMRRILVDFARKRRAGKRGGGGADLPLDDVEHLPGAPADALLELDDALGRLRSVDGRRSRALEHHYFGGLTVEETAEALEVSLGTAERDLRLARAWLAEQLGGTPVASAPGSAAGPRGPSQAKSDHSRSVAEQTCHEMKASSHDKNVHVTR